MTTNTSFIPTSELRDRQLYRLHSRNLLVGVWRADIEAFTGIRDKFNHLFLDTEYHRGPKKGTASAVEDLGVSVEDGVLLIETLPGSWCHNHEVPVPCHWVKDELDGYTGVWHHLVGVDCDNVSPHSHSNQVLFDLVLPWHQKFEALRFKDRELLIREAVREDAAVVSSVKATAALRGYGSFVSRDEIDSWLNKRAAVSFIQERILDKDNYFLVATRDGRVCGGGLIKREEGGAYLADVYVDPPGVGTGKALTEALLTHASEQGWGRVRCFCLNGNTSGVEFFKSFGFQEVGRQVNQELPGELVELVLQQV